jgi:hypothetical protein
MLVEWCGGVAMLMLRSKERLRAGWRSRKAVALVLAMLVVGALGIGQLVGMVRDRMENAMFIQTYQLVQPHQTPKKATPKKKPGAVRESPCYQLTPWGYS